MNAVLDYVRSGQTPFFRMPTHGEQPGAVVIGAPYDGGTTYQPGSRLAPYHVRRVSAWVGGVHPLLDADPVERLRAIDGGNLVVPPFDAAMARELITEQMLPWFAQGVLPIVVGGDHSVTLPLLRAVNKACGPIALLHFDAHFDVTSADVWASDFHHGTFLRNALEEGLVKKLVHVGSRTGLKHVEELAPIRRIEGQVIPAMAFESDSARHLALVAREVVGDLPVYVSIDVDVLDPAFAPGTGTPVAGGLSSRELVQFLRTLAGIRLVGADVVEVNPLLDHADMTSHAAATLAFECLAIGAVSAGSPR